MDRRKKNMLVISITLVITAIIMLASFAVAKYVLKNAQNVDVVLKNAKIAETEIKLSTEDWTNGKVSVSISTNKKGEIYYKVNEKGEWTKYDKSFEVEENCDIYAKLKYTDGEGPETVKKVQNIDKIAPKVIVTKSNYKTFVWNATESTSGIGGYAITTTNTIPTSFTTGETAIGTKEITAAGTYYVWVKDNAGNIGSASISAYTVTRSQGTGSTLTTRLDGTSASAGTSVTSNTVVLGGTTVWASATANTGYNTPVLKNGSTVLTATGATVTVNGNVTISSSATINTYTVTYNYKTNGGTTATKETATVAYGSAIDLTPTATKAGWTFVGWNTSSTAKAKLSSLKMGTGNVTLYAIYSKTIKGTFKYSTDATKDISVSETIYNTATKATLKAPATTEIVVPSGYTFRHWSTSNAANASSTVGAGESITITADTANNPQTQNYYASYNKTVTATFYYSAGASDNVQKSTTAVGVQYLAYDGTKVESTISVPTAVTGSTGYRGTTYKGVSATKSSTTAAPSITTATTTYYAYYQSGITYYYYNGTAHTSSSATRTSTTDGTEYSTAVNTTPTPSAYDGAAFKGWSSSASTVNAVTPNATTVTSLYAYYQKAITGTFNYYDGTKAASTTTSATRTYISKSGGVSTINANYAVPAAVSTSRTIGGVTYTYRGVSTANGANATLATPTTANATFYASYTYPIKVTFDGNGATGTAPTALSGTGYMNYAGTKVGVSLKMPANTFVKTGYKFENWSETKEATSGKYVVGTSYTFTANATLYPAWTIYNYKNTTKSTYFMTLPEALNKAVTGDTIQVIRGRVENTAATVASGKTVTLDLNGQTVIMSNVELTNNGTLTITGASGALTSATGRVVTNNGTFTKSGNCKIEGSSTIGSTIVNNGTATITAGTVSSTNYKAIYNGETSTTAKLTVSGGTIKSKETGIVNKAKGTVTVTNGTITSTGQAVYNEAEGTINISGGAITSTGNNTIVNGSEATGTITISGGTIDNTATDDVGRPCVINYKGNIVIKDNANVNSMYARTVLQYVGDGTIDIQGGTITNSSTTQNTLCYAVGAESGTVKISGGTISSKITNAVRLIVATVNISGGTISTSKGDAIYCASASGKLNISGGTILTTTGAGIAMGYGILTITGGTVKGSSYGIWTSEVNKPTVTIGENDGKISVTKPSITSTNGIGLYIPSGVTCNFYDGVIKGATGKSITGTVTSVATNCVIVKTTSGSTETAVLGPSVPVITAKLDNSSGASYTSGAWTNHNVWVQLKSASIGAGVKNYQWSEDGGATWLTDSLTTTNNIGTITFTADRNKEIWFRAVDNNNVVSTVSKYIIRKDTVVPTVTINRTSTNTFEWKASDAVGVAGYAITTSSSTPTSWTTSGTLTSGTKTISAAGTYYVWIKDNAGNVNKASINAYTVTYDYNGTKNYIVPVSDTIKCTGFSGVTNTCFDLGTIYKDDLEVGDQLTVSFTASYSGLTVVSGQTASLVGQGSGNVTAWDPQFPTRENNGDRHVHWTGTANNVTYTYRTKPLTSTDLTNDSWAFSVRTDYYSAGTITISNVKVTRTTKESNVFLNGAALGTLPAPTERGYTLDGWYTAATGGTEIAATTTVTANATYYAHWVAKSYTMTLAPNGGTYNGTKANSTLVATYGNDVNIGYPVKAGYTFNGWKDSTGKIYDRNLLKNAEAPKEFVDGSKSTNALGGWRTASVSGGTRSVVGYQDLPLPGIRKGFRITASGTATSLDVCQDQVPVTVGKYYTISVWAKGSGGLWLQAGNSSYTSKLFSMSNVTSWTKYSWTFKAGTDGSANNNMTNIYFGNHGATGTIDICGMKLEEGTGFKSTLWANTAANTTLTAQWTANNYTIKIDPNGGKFNNSTSVATYTKTFGSTVAATAPTKTGYTFGGWVPVKTEAGATWAEVLYHNNQGGTTLFANETEAKAVNTAQKYSILGQLETFRANTSSQFEFLLKYDEFGTQYNRWKQTSNPTSGTTISGYSAVSNSWTVNGWGGIAKSSSTSYTFLDGSPSADSWWYAIGSYQPYKKGIPGANNTITMEDMSLYVKVNNDLSNITKAVTGVVDSSNNYIVREDITLKAIWIPNPYTITYDNNYLANDLYKNSVLVNSYGFATTSPKTKTTTDDSSAKYGKVVQLTMNAGTGGGPYLGASRLTVGTTYTWSVYVKANREITLEHIGQEQGGKKAAKITTNWQRITCTFKATDYEHNAFTFYDPSGGWKDGDILYVHSLELSQADKLNTSTAIKTYGNTLASLPAPTRTGYTFAGWYTAPTGGTKIATTTAVPASNTTYYAHWTVNNYYLDLNGNCDGNGASSINGYGTANVVINGVTDETGVTDYYKQWPYGTQYTINNIKATTGHTYNGVASGSASGTITAATTVSLKFTTNKYNLTFQNVYNAFEVKILSSAGALKKTVNVSSSSPTISDILYTDIVQTSTTAVKQTLSGTAFTEVKCSNAPTRTGYTWNSSVRYTMGAENTKAYRWDGTKWYTDHNGDTACTTFSRLASTNGYTAKLTIGWKLNTYSISYNLAGGSVATANPTSYNITSNTITLNNPTKTGYTFLGWTGSSDLSSGLGSYTTSNPYNAAVRDHALGNAFNVAAGSTYRVIVTAKRTKGTLNLGGGIWYTAQSSGNSYDGLGGFTLAETLSDGWARYYRDVKVPDGKTQGKMYIHLEQKSGSYTTAWSVADMSVIPQSTTTTIPKGSVGNRSYRANWKINSYTVTYDYKTNGGTTASKISSVTYGSAIDLTPTATKSGWTFVGWNTSSTAKTKLSSLNMGAGNVTLYAIYSKTLTGTFKYYNNQSKTVPITIYNTATSGKITAPGALGTPDGWKFRHWSTSSAANASSSVAASGSVTISANTTYFASYQQTVTATFYYHKGTDQFNTTQTSETASGTKYMGYAGATVNGSISIPSEVTGSTAIYGCNYAGVSTSTDSLTAATAVTTEKTKYYAYYDVGVTYYYYNGSKIVSTNPSNSRRRATSNGSAYVVTATNVPSTTAKYDSAAFVSWTYDQSKIDSRTPTTTAVTTLYAYYQKSVTATFRYSTGSDTATTTAPGTKSYITNTSAMRTVHGNITIPNAAKADRNMFGTPAKFNGVSTATAANATNVTPTTANTTYYTNYKYTVKVTYNSNGATTGSAPAASSGTGYINYQGNIYGYHLTMPSNTTNMAKVVQVGSGQSLQNITCQFNGWNEKTDGTGRAYTVGTKYEFIKDTTIYARWFRPIYKNTTTNKTYDIFQYAVNEATSGQKIQMQQTNTVEPVQINIPSDKTIYLDLNNKTMNITKTILNYGNLYVNSGTSGGGIESTGGVAAIHSDGDTLYLGNCSIKSDGYGVELNAMGRFEGTGIIATKNSVVYNAAGITTTVVNCYLQSTSITGVYTKNGIFMANKTTIQGDYGLYNENAIVELYGGTKVTGTTHAGAINWSGYSGTIKVGLDGNTYSTSEVTVTGKTYGISRNSGTVIFNNGTIKGESGAISGTYSVRSGYSAVSTTSGSYKVLTLKAASSDPAGNMPSLSSLAPMSRAKAVNIGVNNNVTNDEIEESDTNESNSVENTEEENKNTTEESTSQNETNNITTDEEKLKEYTENQIKNAKKNEEKYKTEDLYVRYEGKTYSDNPEDIQKKNKELDLNVATLWKDTTNTKEDAIVYNGKWLENYLELDGKTTYAVLNNIQSDTITLEATIELPKETEDRTEQVKNKEENNETEQEEQLIIGNEKVEIYITKDKKIVGKLHIKDKEYTVTSTIKIEPEKVYGIALTYDGENIRLYVNDKEEQTAEVKGSIKETKEDSLMSVGAKYTEDEEGKEVITNYFEGKIYSVAIYKKALSKDDVVNNYNYNINYFKSKEQ